MTRPDFLLYYIGSNTFHTEAVYRDFDGFRQSLLNELSKKIILF